MYVILFFYNASLITSRPHHQAGLHLNLTSREGLILHDNGAAAGQNHNVKVLLLVVGLLVPLPHDIGVVGRDQSDLTQEGKKI